MISYFMIYYVWINVSKYKSTYKQHFNRFPNLRFELVGMIDGVEQTRKHCLVTQIDLLISSTPLQSWKGLLLCLLISMLNEARIIYW